MNKVNTKNTQEVSDNKLFVGLLTVNPGRDFIKFEEIDYPGYSRKMITKKSRKFKFSKYPKKYKMQTVYAIGYFKSITAKNYFDFTKLDHPFTFERENEIVFDLPEELMNALLKEKYES